MDTNPKHPLQVIYESMLKDESFYVDFANNYLKFVKETVPAMMHKEELSEEETLKFVYQDTGTFANLGEGKTNPKGLKGDNKIDNIKLKIFFDNCSEALQDNKLGEIIYNEDTLLQLYKGVITKIDEGKTELDYLKTQKTKQLYVIVNRMLAAVFPKYFGTLINFDNTQKSTKTTDNNKDDKEPVNIIEVLSKINQFISKSGNSIPSIDIGNSWLECNKHYFEYCNKHIKLTEDEDENKEYHISLLLEYLHRKENNELMKIYKKKSENIILKETSDLLLQTKNLILTGAPGTGKTYLAKQIADVLTKNDNECVTMVQFHPSYDYTDFVEGIRPIDNGNGEIGFERKDGTFKEFCKKAISKKDEKYVFIIDEINRGEISKIFGELFYAIDPGYRGKNGRIKTQYQNLLEGTDDTFEEGFYVPENVYIIGTMNDIDRSVDSFDFAMRRRFAWKEITAEDTQHSILDSLQDDKRNEAINRMNSLNKAISEMPELGTQYQLGASYFLKLEHYDYDFEKLWHFHIKGLLYEYLRGVPGADSKLADLKKAYEPENEQ